VADPIPTRPIDAKIYRIIQDRPGATTTDIAFTGLDIGLPEMVRSLQRLEQSGQIARHLKGFIAL
jgi:hypothetical protein